MRLAGEEHEALDLCGECVEGEVQQDGQGTEGQAITSAALEALIEQQQYRCALSGVPLSPDDSALDHKHPVKRGGTHCISNLQWLEPAVNKAKHTMTNDEFVAMCRRVVAWFDKT